MIHKKDVDEVNFTLNHLGDNAVIIEVANQINASAQMTLLSITTLLDETNPNWLIEYIPAYTTMTIFYKIEAFSGNFASPFEAVSLEIKRLLSHVKDVPTIKEKTVEIPVLYGEEYGPDLSFVAAYNHLTISEVINLHTTGVYSVHMIGFSPGFPFTSGLSPLIATPRKETPLLRIPARSVGIAGTQTGVYPIETPGGWQLIGRTPKELFLPDAEIPSLLKAGDKIKFYQITLEEYNEIRGNA